MPYRHICLLALCVLGVVLVSPVQALVIRCSDPHWMDRSAFTRLGDLFGHPQDNPTRLALFTDPTQRTGLYFSAQLDTAVRYIPAGSTAILQLLLDGDSIPRTYRFALPVTTSSARTLYLGLTDPMFAGGNKRSAPRILAWHVSIIDAQATSLAQAHSPLWSF